MPTSLSYVIWDVSPFLFPGVEFLRWYGLMWATGMIAGYKLLCHLCQKEALTVEQIDRLVQYLIIGIILGARLGHILFYDPIHYWNNPVELLPFRLEPHFHFVGLAGLASHGGVAGALIALYLYIRKYDQPMLWLLDRLTIAAALLGCFIRLGNLLNSEIIGVPTSVPWAFIFTRVDPLPRHPAQLYEAIFYLIICLVLYSIWKNTNWKNYHGLIFGFGLSLIFFQRFMVEFLKENQVAFEEGLAINMGQMLSIPMILLGVSIIIWSMRIPKSRVKV